jgi:hypothetical protein
VVALLRIGFAAFDSWLLRIGGMGLMSGGGRWLFCILFLFFVKIGGVKPSQSKIKMRPHLCFTDKKMRPQNQIKCYVLNQRILWGATTYFFSWE